MKFNYLIQSMRENRDNYGTGNIDIEISIPIGIVEINNREDVGNYLLDTLLLEKCGMTLNELKDKIPEEFI